VRLAAQGARRPQTVPCETRRVPQGSFRRGNLFAISAEPVSKYRVWDWEVINLELFKMAVRVRRKSRPGAARLSAGGGIAAVAALSGVDLLARRAEQKF